MPCVAFSSTSDASDEPSRVQPAAQTASCARAPTTPPIPAAEDYHKCKPGGKSLASSGLPTDLAARRNDFGHCANVRGAHGSRLSPRDHIPFGNGQIHSINGPRQGEKDSRRLRLASSAGRPRFATCLGLALPCAGIRPVRGQCAVDPGLFDRRGRTGVARADESPRRLAVG